MTCGNAPGPGGSPLCIRNNLLASWLVEVGFGKKMCTVHTVHTAQAVTHLRVTCGNAPRGGLVQVQVPPATGKEKV